MRGESKKQREIFVMVTNKCNLKCRYCYEATKNNQFVPVARMKELLAAEFESSRDKYSEFFLIFHGGEPFLAFDELRSLSEWAWEHYPEMNITCLTTTNGTWLSPEMKTWLVTNKHRFVPILSLDGLKETHDLNRSNSYDKIDRAFFLTHWPGQAVKMTIAPNSIGELYENYVGLRAQGFLVNPSLAKEVDWDLKRDLPVFAAEMKKLASYFIDHPEEVPCELINVPVHQFAPQVTVPNHNACGAGGHIVTFDTRGNRYPCHAFIGDPTAPYQAEAIDQSFKILSENNSLRVSPGCANCFVASVCSPCYGLNFAERGDMGRFDPRMCEFTKVRVLACAEMLANMMEEREKYPALNGKSEEELFFTVSGIRAVFGNVYVSTTPQMVSESL